MEILACKLSMPIRKYNLHSHKSWEIVCQLEGEVRTQVGENYFSLYPNEIMLIPPDVPHRGYSNGLFRDIALCATGIEFKEFEIIKDYRGEIASIISIIARLFTEQEGDYKPVADSLVKAVYQMINHKIGTSSDSPAVEQIKKDIYKNLSNQNFNLAAAIAETGFDKDYFRRCFKRETGKTPNQYLTFMRIVNAKQLLADNRFFSIEAVAHSCGFSDSLYFSTCFKKHVGVSPLAYRKSLIDNG